MKLHFCRHCIAVAIIAGLPFLAHAAGGGLLWTNQFDLAAGTDQALAVTGKGRQAFVAGRVRNATLNHDWHVAAYDVVTGAVLWTNQLDVAAGRDEALAIALAGKAVAAAGRIRSTGNDDWYVRAYDTQTGTVLWSDQYNLTNANDRANAIAASKTTFVAAGRVRNVAGNDDWAVRAYDALTGKLLWQDQYDAAADNDDAVAVTILGKKAIVVGHVTTGAGDTDWFVRAYDLQNGSVLWSNQFDGVAGDDEALAVLGRGRTVFVAGSVVNGNGNTDFTIRAYDAGTGNLLWNDQYDLANNDDRAVSLALRGKTLVAAGSARNLNGDADFLVRTYNAGTGQFLWQDRLNPAGADDTAFATTVAGSTVLAVGRVTNAQGNTDWLVRAYQLTTGEPLWSDQYDQIAGDDEALGVIALGSRVMVVGDSDNAAGNADWLVRTSSLK
jgi:hypothetical protein